MQIQGITWHAVVLEADEFAATKKLVTEVFGLISYRAGRLGLVPHVERHDSRPVRTRAHNLMPSAPRCNGR